MEPVTHLSWSFLQKNVKGLQPKTVFAKISTLETSCVQLIYNPDWSRLFLQQTKQPMQCNLPQTICTRLSKRKGEVGVNILFQLHTLLLDKKIFNIVRSPDIPWFFSLQIIPSCQCHTLLKVLEQPRKIPRTSRDP